MVVLETGVQKARTRKHPTAINVACTHFMWTSVERIHVEGRKISCSYKLVKSLASLLHKRVCAQDIHIHKSKYALCPRTSTMTGLESIVLRSGHISFHGCTPECLICTKYVTGNKNVRLWPCANATITGVASRVSMQ